MEQNIGQFIKKDKIKNENCRDENAKISVWYDKVG